MLVYMLTLAGVAGVLLASAFAGKVHHGTWSALVLLNLRRFLIPFAVTGVVFSGLQIWLALSDDFEAASRTIREIEIELARLRTVVIFLKPAPWLEAALFIALLTLLVWPAAVSMSRVTAVFRRYLKFISTAYVWLSLLTSVTFFGAVAAHNSGPLAQRIATFERHVDRIEMRYGSLVDAAALQLGSEWLPHLIQSRDDSDDDNWPAIIAFAVELDRYMNSLPPSYPGLFGGPEDGGKPPPPPPGTGPTSPAAAAAAIALLEHPIERPGLRPKDPLSRLTATTGWAKGPLAQRKPAPPSRTLLPPEVLARDLAGQFPRYAKDIEAVPTKVVAKRVSDHVQATRDVWSEEKAAKAEEQLKGTTAAAWSTRRSGALFSAIGARLASAGYESQTDRVLDAFKDDPALGLPLGIISAFVEAVINDTVKAAIATAADQTTARWLRGGSFAEAAVEFGRDASAAVERHSGLMLRERLTALRGRLTALRSRWEADKVELPAQLQALSSENSATRWAGFESVSNQASIDLPPALRGPAALSLTRMKDVFEQLDVPNRLARLEALESVWLASAPQLAVSRIGAMLRCEALMGLNATEFEKAALAALPSLLAKDLDRPSDAETLADASLQGYDIEPSQKAEMVDAIVRERARSLRSPAAAEAFVLASRASSPAQGHEQFNATMRAGCGLRGTIDTYKVVNGVKYGPVTSRPFTVPCF